MHLIDTIFHFTSIDNLKAIISKGFSPSFSKEKLGERDILIPMISFSNILLRDIGKNQVLNYGEYGIGFSRAWAIKNKINPVIYSFNNGETSNAIRKYLDNSVFISRVEEYKNFFKENSKLQLGPLFNHVKLSNTSAEAINLLNYLSLNYNETLLELISKYANANFQETKSLIYLTKPYEVKNNAEQKFIAYNDREWRKVYKEIGFILDVEESFQKTLNMPKPHIKDEIYRLKFNLEDIVVIVVQKGIDIKTIIDCLSLKFGKKDVANLITSKKLKVNTRAQLILKGF